MKFHPMSLAESLCHKLMVVPRRHRRLAAELSQHPIGCQPRQLLFPEIGTVSAPPVVNRVLDDSGSYRIQMNVPDELEQIALGIDHQGLVAALEQVPDAPLAPIDPARVSKRQVLKDLGKRYRPHLYREVEVVGHAAKRMYPMTETIHSVLNQVVQVLIIAILEKYQLATVPTKHDVVYRTRDMKAGLASHTASYAPRHNKSINQVNQA